MWIRGILLATGAGLIGVGLHLHEPLPLVCGVISVIGAALSIRYHRQRRRDR